MMWSTVSIADKPTTLLVDASRNVQGWEAEFCDRFFASMKRRDLSLIGSAPIRVGDAEELTSCMRHQEEFNCILLFGHGEGEKDAPWANLRSYWEWLSSRAGLSPKLFAACTWESYDPEVSQEILESPNSFAPRALAPQSALTPREAGLFYLKFFTELYDHSIDSITGKMAWFSHSKARALPRRRKLPGSVGVRC